MDSKCKKETKKDYSLIRQENYTQTPQTQET